MAEEFVNTIFLLFFNSYSIVFSENFIDKIADLLIRTNYDFLIEKCIHFFTPTN